MEMNIARLNQDAKTAAPVARPALGLGFGFGFADIIAKADPARFTTWYAARNLLETSPRANRR